MAKQSKNGGGASSSDKVCFYCRKKGYIGKHCFKRKNNENEESANKTKVRDGHDEYAFTTRYVFCDVNMSDDINEYANMANHVSSNGNMSDSIVDS